MPAVPTLEPPMQARWLRLVSCVTPQDAYGKLYIVPGVKRKNIHGINLL